MSQSFYTECSSPSYLFQPVSATEKDNEKFKACKKNQPNYTGSGKLQYVWGDDHN